MEKAILRRQRIQIDAFGAGSEHARTYYVMSILDEVMEFFELENFGISVEHPLSGRNDAVEFVFLARNPDRSPVGFVLELEKDDFEQGLFILTIWTSSYY